MKICIDVSPAVHHRAGIGRYVRELTTALMALGSQHEYIAFFNRSSKANIIPPLDRLPQTKKTWGDKRWKIYALLAHWCRLPQDQLFRGIDLFHATDHLLPYFLGLRSVFTLQDLSFRLFPGTHTILNRYFLSLMMPLSLRNADRVIAVSEWTKRDAVRFYGVDSEKIQVIPHGVSRNFKRVHDLEYLKAFRHLYRLPEKFLLFVGTIEPRKNLPTLFEAFQQSQIPGLKLVIAGKKGWQDKTIFSNLKRTGLEERVVFTGYIPDEDLPSLYTLATAFVFPSLYEGFGLPVLEAMACGAPVLCSNSSSLPEVAGEAAIFISPTDVGDWVRAIRQTFQNRPLLADLQQRGFKRAALFTWENTARKTLEVYQAAYAHRP